MMKKIKLIIASLFLVIMPTASFALIDVAAFGSYTFSSGSPINTGGLGYGFDAHLNTTFLTVFKTGFGGYYRTSDVKIDVLGVNEKFPKQQLGIDLYGALSIPIFPMEPYLKFRAAALEKIGGSFNSTEHFKAYSWGFGILFNMFPISSIMKVGLYGEFLCDVSKNSGKRGDGHTFNLGVRVDLF